MSHTAITSLFPRNARTLALQMAMEAAQRAEVGQRIKELRGPLPQPELARRLGVSLRAVQKWESGDSAPQWENLVGLSKEFGVTQNFLLYGEPDSQPAESQLDRIEAKVDQILEIVSAFVPELHEVFERAADRNDAQQQPPTSGRKRTPPRRRAA